MALVVPLAAVGMAVIVVVLLAVRWVAVVVGVGGDTLSSTPMPSRWT